MSTVNTQLTDAERLILSNQFTILAALSKDASDRELHAARAQNLLHGHEMLYRDLFEKMSPVMSDALAEDVTDVLVLFAIMKTSYIALTDKGDVPAHAVDWPGFDGNEEPELLRFTRALIAANQFKHVLGDDARNSHAPMLAAYQRMLGAWRAAGSPSFTDLADLKAIIAARRHPGA